MYFNENDTFPASWLRNLWPDATVDERSIADVSADELVGYRRCHFFGGIGGWEYALQLAGWPDEWPVWTGSCPCQPFSQAGKHRGEADERHLWPEFYRLIGESRPLYIFGEQVAGTDGRRWLAGIHTDLEALGYTFGAADLCAASVGAPHIRQRLFWVAIANKSRLERRQYQHDRERPTCARGVQTPWHGTACRGAIAKGQQMGRARQSREVSSSGVEHPNRTSQHKWTPGRQQSLCHEYGTSSIGRGNPSQSRQHDARRISSYEGTHGWKPERDYLSFWDDYDLIPCEQGKLRRIEPGTPPLAHGVPSRMGKIRAYGNAIVPQVAARFIQAVREVICEY